MSVTEVEGDYLAYWLNTFISSGIITREHLLYQNIDAFLTEQLSQPNPVTKWEQWPTLFSYCESLAELATRKGYMFYLGGKRFGLKGHNDVVAPVVSYCHPGPSLATLDSRTLTPVYDSGPHLNNLMLLLTLLDSLDGIPCFKSLGLKKFFTVVHYDGMPLNIGTFPRQENGQTFFDGIIPTIELAKMRELYQEGNATVHKFISDNCSWISEVKEFDVCDASGQVHVNMFTKFSSTGGDAGSVKRELSEVFECLEACTNCLLADNAKNCRYPSLKEVCTRCEGLDIKSQPCISAKCIHVSSDQAPSQRKAHIELNSVASNDVNSANYRFYGFGLLHFCKNCISSLRHYRLTDMSGTFFVALLSSIWASSTSEAKKMKSVAPASVFAFRDAHSDEIGYQTVSKPMEDIVKETGNIVTTLVPEQYKPTAVEAKTHSILGRPLYITRNANGDFLWTDAEYEFVGMGNRHIPSKCIALGTFDKPGPAHQCPVIASKASFSHPAGIDVLIIQPGKNEIAFVCDKGNSCIRFIKGVHTIQGDKFIGTLKVQPIPANWKPEGLAVIAKDTIAITEGTTLNLVCMESTFNAGQLVKVVSNLQSPHGLCLSGTEGTVFVADGQSVKQIDLEDKSIRVTCHGFKQAFDVALSTNGKLGVTDVQAHKISILEQGQNNTYTVKSNIGTGNFGCADGPAAKAQLSEPTGLCFDFDTAIFCCFGGSKNGYIKIHTSVEFACTFMSKIREIYHAIGFVPKKEQNRLAQTGTKPAAPFVECTSKLIDSLAYLESLTNQRKDYLNAATAGPEGTVYHASLNGFAETVKGLEAHIQSLELVEMHDVLDKFNLYAFVNESRKEHGFAKHKQKGQYRHPTLQQYVRSKDRHEVELIKKTCQCPHAYHTNTFSAYQPSHRSNLSSVKTIAQYKKWSEQFHPHQIQMSSEETKEDFKVARMLNVLTKARPSQNIRDLYRYKCGYGPCVIIQKDMLLQGNADQIELHYPAFADLMRGLEVRRGENTLEMGRVPSNNYLFLPGDIVAVNPGTDNGIPSGDKWWLLQVNKPHESKRDKSGCHVFGFWLDEQATEESTTGKHYALLPNPVKVYFGSIIKDNKIPVVVPVEELSSGWQSGHVLFTFTNEYCEKLDEISDAFRRELNISESGAEESDMESESSDDGDQQPDIHEVEIIAMEHRRRVMRNAEGQVLTSYRDLLNPHHVRRQPRQTQRLVITETELEAERNCLEFDHSV